MQEELKKEEAEKKKYAYWLDHVPGVGKITRQRLLEKRNPKELFSCSYEAVEAAVTLKQWKALEESRSQWDVDKEWDKLVSRGIGVEVLGGLTYPKRLAEIPDSPFILYYKGQRSLLEEPMVAVVGTRACSAYGSLAAKELGRELAGWGITVISGMARGVDGICQWSAMEHGGKSVGVLGSGIEVCYPRENKALYERLAKEGCLISENPPFTEPYAGLFPLRNRIISGLAEVIAVVEAREKSGTLITVDMALEQGKEVYVMPGRITEQCSRGCNKLIKQGAGVILSPKEFVDEIAPLLLAKKQTKRSLSESDTVNMTEEERRIFEFLTVDGKSMEELWLLAREHSNAITLAEVMTIVLRLCKKGAVMGREQYYYRNRW